jgi:hypothetical protein
VAICHRPGNEDVVGKDGSKDSNIVEVSPAGIGIIRDEDVSFVNIPGKFLEYVLANEVMSADMNSNILISLHNGVSCGIGQTAGKIL